MGHIHSADRSVPLESMHVRQWESTRCLSVFILQACVSQMHPLSQNMTPFTSTTILLRYSPFSSSFAPCFFSICSYNYLSLIFPSFPLLFSLLSFLHNDRLLQLNLNICKYLFFQLFLFSNRRSKKKGIDVREIGRGLVKQQVRGSLMRKIKAK